MKEKNYTFAIYTVSRYFKYLQQINRNAVWVLNLKHCKTEIKCIQNSANDKKIKQNLCLTP